MRTYSLCHSCAVWVVNNDSSEGGIPSESARIEEMGLVSVSEHDFEGYFECFVCGHSEIGHGYIAEPILELS